MKKILAHTVYDKIYIPILKKLSVSANISLSAHNLHQNIFDIFYKEKPDIVLLPINEYTQEFHAFVENMQKKTNIILFLGNFEHHDLVQYCSSNKIEIIKQVKSDPVNIEYEYLYDSLIFFDKKIQRNDKILVILSDDNNKNHQMLNNILYPKTNLDIVLINNSKYNSYHNIGLANDNDLCILMNSYKTLIDLNGSYQLEAQACGIPYLKTDQDLLISIENMDTKEHIDNLDNYSIELFVKNKLLPKIGA